MNKEIEKYLIAALKENTLKLDFQPQMCYENEIFKIVGVEALLRPDFACNVEEFINVATEIGCIGEVGYWVFENAANYLKRWIDKKLVPVTFTMSINISVPQLEDPDFIQKIIKMTRVADLDSSQIILELTEAAAVSDLTLKKIYQLSNNGFKISIDDFGTGYSSLSRLKYLPIDEIKVDKVFVNDITKTKQDIALITAIYQLTTALGKTSMVEGVEDASQLKILKEIGFDCFQGYFFSEPLSVVDLEDLFSLTKLLHCQ